jgi:hypothetical protein
MNTINQSINQSINQYLPHKPCTLMSVVLQYAVTNVRWPTYEQLDVIQFLPSAGSDIKLLPLKSNKMF